MSQKISKELKQAILEMPEREKDKLLLRLVVKDAMLLKKLNHQLLEDEVDAEEQRKALAEAIEARFQSESFAYWSHTPGLVMMEMRDFSGAIGRHVKITQDKYGEIQLLLRLVNMPFRTQAKLLKKEQRRAEKFAAYVCKKAQIILQKLNKLDRDFYLEFDQEVNEMLDHLKQYPPTISLMDEYRLPATWEY